MARPRSVRANLPHPFRYRLSIALCRAPPPAISLRIFLSLFEIAPPHENSRGRLASDDHSNRRLDPTVPYLGKDSRSGHLWGIGGRLLGAKGGARRFHALTWCVRTGPGLELELCAKNIELKEGEAIRDLCFRGPVRLKTILVPALAFPQYHLSIKGELPSVHQRVQGCTGYCATSDSPKLAPQRYWADSSAMRWRK